MILTYVYGDRGNACLKNNFYLIIVLLLVVQSIFSATAAPAYTYAHKTLYSNHDSVRSRRTPFVEVKNSTSHGLGPREEARAMCSVRTQEVNATANAIITRRLHGVVTSRELHTSIQRLELIIFGQMQQLWQSLDALRAQLASHGSGRETVRLPDRRTVAFKYQPDAG